MNTDYSSMGYDAHDTRTTFFLIVDDNVELAGLVADRLAEDGYTADIVHTGAAGLRRLESGYYSAILLDYHLPDMNGGDFVRTLNQRDMRIPFIVMTWQSSERIFIEMMNLGARGYVIKELGFLNAIAQDVRRLHEKLQIEYRHAETVAALRASEERYRSFVQNFQGVAVRYDAKMRPVFFHGAVKKITGRTEQELMEIPDGWLGIVHPDDRRNLELGTGQDKLLELPFFSTEREYRIIHTDGTVKWVHELIQNACGTNGSVQYVQSSIYDITERKKTEQEKTALEMQLLHLQKMEAVGRLAGGVAHDFNNLLTVIKGYGGLLLSDLSPDNPARDHANEIIKAADSAQMITKQLLAFSSKQVSQMQSINLSDIVRNTRKMLTRLLGETITLELDLHDCGEIDADPVQMEQVLINMTINARDAITGTGKVCLRTERVRIESERARYIIGAYPGDFVRLSLEDTGCGMSRETMKHIFEPFFTTKEFGKGTGLGLSVVYGIIHQYRGWINVYSEQGAGTVFHVYLPLKSDALRNSTPTLRAEIRHHGAGQRILLVEDEDSVLKFAQMILGKYGYRIFTASSIGEAREVFQAEGGRFDVVFSDIMLPDGTGLNLAYELTGYNPALRVLLSSGHTGERLDINRIRTHGFHFLQKPYSISELLTTLHEVVTMEPSPPTS